MIDAKLYYTAPSDEEFEELKRESIKIWATIGDEASYCAEKDERIKNIRNFKDNFMYMVAMFDSGNQRKLANNLSEKTRSSVRERMIDGGMPINQVTF